MTQLRHPETLTEAVSKHIREAVLRGDYAPGARLAEGTLAATLGTSRGTIREALVSLAQAGLVVIRPHRGAFVASLNAQQAWETYTLRALLEGYAARLAVERDLVDDEATEMLQSVLDDLVAAIDSDSLAVIIEADMRFHARLSSLCGHVMLQKHLASLQEHTRRFITLSSLHKSDLFEDADSHRQLLDVLRTKDPDKIEQAVRTHIRVAGELLVAKLAASDSATGGGPTDDWRDGDGLGPPPATEPSEAVAAGR